MRDRPRLVHLTTTDMSLALLLGPQLQAFAAAGYEVIGASAPGPYVEALARDGIRHVAVHNATRAMALRRDVAALRELHRLFRDLRPDIVHTHNPKPGVYGRLTAKAARVPVIVNTVHGLYALPEYPLAKRTVVYALERVASTCSDAELVQNPDDLETLARLRVPRRKLHLLGNGIDLARFDPDRLRPQRAAVRAELGLDDDAVVVGAVGRLVVEKGYRELLAAAVRLHELERRAVLVVVGHDEPDKEDAITAEDKARAAATGAVRFVGARDDVERVLTAFDVFVLASWREGFPRSAMEAAAMGLPIVITDIRGCREVVDDGVNGTRVPVRDEHALVQALADLVQDAGLRARYGEAGRHKATREFDQQRVIDITLATYERLRR